MRPNKPYLSSDPSDLASPLPSPMETLVTWPVVGRPALSPWRLVAAAGAITEAISHLPLLMSSLSDTPYIGVGFLLLAVAGFLLALLFVVSDTPAVWVSAVVIAALALLGYILSRTTGLPDFNDHKGDWSYPLGVVSIVGEAMMIAAALLHVAQTRRRAGR